MRAIEYNGERHSIREWAEIAGISDTVLRHRLRRGWSIEDALKRPVLKGRRCTSKLMLTLDGEARPLWEWAEIKNMSYKAIYIRYKNGWDAEDIFSKPIRKKRRRCNMDCFNCIFDDCIKE